jgi:ABC-2 type transport system ATP-binding protein
MGVIATEGLTKHYHAGGLRARVGGASGLRRSPGRGGAIRALQNVTLDVREGEVFGFLGPNGAGKSTLIRLLLGFLHPTAGGARVLGLDIVRDSVAIRARVGYLPGGIALYDGLTGERHLDYLAELSAREPVRRDALCDRLELSARTLRRPIRDYSRGMRQKVGIVQALQHDPELAILDEPSEGLDPLMQRAFYDILDDLRRDGRTVFLSSHVLAEVERVCDRVAIVRAGRLVALEDVAELIRRRKRRVDIELDGPAPDLSAVPGISELVVSERRITCALEGDPRPLLAALGGAPVTDVTIEPARLEDAFLELYAGEEAAEAADADAAGDAAGGEDAGGPVAPEAGR